MKTRTQKGDFPIFLEYASFFCAGRYVCPHEKFFISSDVYWTHSSSSFVSLFINFSKQLFCDKNACSVYGEL